MPHGDVFVRHRRSPRVPRAAPQSRSGARRRRWPVRRVSVLGTAAGAKQYPPLDAERIAALQAGDSEATRPGSCSRSSWVLRRGSSRSAGASHATASEGAARRAGSSNAPAIARSTRRCTRLDVRLARRSCPVGRADRPQAAAAHEQDRAVRPRSRRAAVPRDPARHDRRGRDRSRATHGPPRRWRGLTLLVPFRAAGCSSANQRAFAVEVTARVRGPSCVRDDAARNE